MGRLQSDTSQVWLCGYVRLPPPLSSELCEVSLRSFLRTERAVSFPGQREEAENNTVVLNNSLGKQRLELVSLLA